MATETVWVGERASEPGGKGSGGSGTVALGSEDGPRGRALYRWSEGISSELEAFGREHCSGSDVRSSEEHGERQKGCGNGLRPEGKVLLRRPDFSWSQKVNVCSG